MPPSFPGRRERVDAVVIGAGHNGLVAANVLAEAGWDVLVLEAQPRAGGAVASEQIHPGFTADLFSAFYPLAAASPVIAGLGLEEYGLRWCHSPAVLAHVLEDGREAVISRDLDATAASLDAWAPGDGDRWRGLFATWQRLRGPLLDALFRPFPPVRPAVRLLSLLGARNGLAFARFATLDVRRFTQERFRGQGAALLLAGNALHTDLGPESAISAPFGWLLAMLAQDVGFPVPRGGAGELIAAMLARLAAHGGQVRCGARVAEVLVRGGRAVGVRTEDGGEVLARHGVLADVAAPHLLERLVPPDAVPAATRRDLTRFTWDHATLKVNWALSGPVPWDAPGARRAGTVHLGGDLDGLTGYAGDLARGQLPRDPFVLMGQMTTADPSRSPAGTESAWAYTHVPRNRATAADAMAGHVERIERVIERHAPGFRSAILTRQVQTPLDLQASDANLDLGAINGGTAALYQQLVFRPVPGLSRPELPIEGLFLASASAHPGGGVHGACGANAARAALLRRGRIGRLASRAVTAAQVRL